MKENLPLYYSLTSTKGGGKLGYRIGKTIRRLVPNLGIFWLQSTAFIYTPPRYFVISLTQIKGPI
jgi:hypothetical protein